jgi:uncharacterized protein
VLFASDGRPLPQPTPVARPFFEGLAREQLLLPCCSRDGFFFYPRNRCPICLQSDWTWETASGHGRVYSVTVDRVGHDPALKAHLPLIIAVIELEEGPRLVANITGTSPENVQVGSPVVACFVLCDRQSLLQFRLT